MIGVYLTFFNYNDAFCALCVCNMMFLLFFLGICGYLLCALCVAVKNFFAWYVQIFYLFFMCGCLEFFVFAWYLQVKIVCLIRVWWVITFTYCNFIESFFALWVCNMMFLFFLGICNFSLCTLCVAAENYLFLRG